MPPRKTVNCFCCVEDSDGVMVYCPKCRSWQHAECVNMNQFCDADNKYMCPTCRGMSIGCRCEYEGDYQKALVICLHCGMFQHKRHEGLGFGAVPEDYRCRKCRKGAALKKVSRKLKVVSSFPNIPSEVELKSVSTCPHKVPPGRFCTRLGQFTGVVKPLEFISTLYSEFRDVMFRAHPSLAFFKYFEFKPQDYIDDASCFIYFFVRAVSHMTGASTREVTAILNHLICLDVYKSPKPSAAQNKPTKPYPQLARHQTEIEFSERAMIALEDENVLEISDDFELPRLALIPDDEATTTVISLSDIKNGDLICEIFGEISVFEELDRDSVSPVYSQLCVSKTSLMVDSLKQNNNVLYTRIRHSIYYNCEIRPFSLNGSLRIGLFAVTPSIMPMMMEKVNDAPVDAIKSGDELFMPFDIAPVIERWEGDWRSSKTRKMDLDLDMFKPPCPSLIMEGKSDVRSIDRKKHKTGTIGSLVSFFDDSTPFFFEILPDDGSQEPAQRHPDLPKFVSRLNPRGLKPFMPRYEEPRQAEIPQFWFSQVPDLRSPMKCSHCGHSSLVGSSQSVFTCHACFGQTCTKCAGHSHPGMPCDRVDTGEVKVSAEVVKSCCGCGAEFIRERECNRIECPHCHTIMCYSCKQKVDRYKHFSTKNEPGKCPLFM